MYIFMWKWYTINKHKIMGNNKKRENCQSVYTCNVLKNLFFYGNRSFPSPLQQKVILLSYEEGQKAWNICMLVKRKTHSYHCMEQSFLLRIMIKRENHFLSSLRMSPTSRMAILTCLRVCRTPYYPLGKWGASCYLNISNNSNNIALGKQRHL